MGINRWLLAAVALTVGLAVGFASCWVFVRKGAEVAATAELYASGEASRRNDFAAAMLHAQRASCHAPNSYDPFEAIGDIYASAELKSAAKASYELALGQLALHQERAMLVGQGSVDPQAAELHLKRKLSALAGLR